jgi:hypothetical protein
VPRSQGFHDRFQSSRAHSHEGLQRHHLDRLAAGAPGLMHRLADREQADDQDQDVDAV